MKKIIAIIITAMILLSIVPASVFASAEALSISSISSPSGDIDINLGKITITFDDEVNAADLNKITFKKTSGGANIKGAVYVTKSETNVNSAEVRFGKLEDGVDYTLTIPTDYVSANSKSLAVDATYTYTAKKTYINRT